METVNIYKVTKCEIFGESAVFRYEVEDRECYNLYK